MTLSIAVSAQLFASYAFAACAVTPEASHTIVRGRFVRCEDASFHLQASGAYRSYERDIEAALARVRPEDRGTLLERLGVTADFPYDGTLDGRVVVVAVSWQASIAPWTSETSRAVEFMGAPREVEEAVRYWWRGPIEACETLTTGAQMDLWVYPECCDTIEFAAPVCLLPMNYAEPAPDAMSDAIARHRRDAWPMILVDLAEIGAAGDTKAEQ